MSGFLLVCHVGNTTDPDGIDPSLVPEMEGKMLNLIRLLIDKYGPPRQFFFTPYRAGRESWSHCRKLLDQYGVSCRADQMLSKRLAHPDATSYLGEYTLKVGPPVGESLDAFAERVARAYHRYKEEARVRGPVWVMTHTDVLLELAKLDGKLPQAATRIDYHTYFRMGDKAATTDYQTSKVPVPEPVYALRGTADLVEGPPIKTPMPTVVRVPAASSSSPVVYYTPPTTAHIPPSRAAPSHIPPTSHLPPPPTPVQPPPQPSAASSSVPEHICQTCGRDTRHPHSTPFPDPWVDMFDPHQPKVYKSPQEKQALRARRRIVITGDPFMTNREEMSPADLSATVRLPGSEMTAFTGNGEEETGFVLASSTASTSRINPAKLMGLPYKKMEIAPGRIF
jgi:hypothetical protein